MLGPVTACILSLYAVYLASADETVAAGLAAALALLAIWQAWRMRRSEHTTNGGLWLASVNVCGSLLACVVAGSDALPWAYLALIGNYFVCERGTAMLIGVPVLLALAGLPGLIESWAEGFSVITVAVLTNALGFAVSLQLQNDRVHLEELASIDALTNLPNRRMLERALVRQIGERRDGKRLNGLVILDIDHFKEVNDLYGHTAGDSALADLATILRFEVRGPDQVFRFGGEEFVVLMRIASVEELEQATERLRKAVRGALRGPGGQITISLGAAGYAGESHWQDWFSRADAALYLAKNTGRDSYRIADLLD